MKLEFSQYIFEKYSNITKILTERVELFHWKDRHDEANSLFSQLW